MLTGLYAHQHYPSDYQRQPPAARLPDLGHLPAQLRLCDAVVRQVARVGGSGWRIYTAVQLSRTIWLYGLYPTSTARPARENAPRMGGIGGTFAAWLNGASGNGKPWCATVSFVNPHDIMFFPRYMPAGGNNPPSVFDAKPANFEAPAMRSRPTNRACNCNCFRLPIASWRMGYLETPPAERPQRAAAR